MTITIYPPEKQAVGNFDGGKITELKPIGFPREGSAVKGIGPLFYWAWAHAKEEGHIPMHPHQAFEIITYMVNAQAEHSDTLGTRSIVTAGGLQVMQTGSGVSHSEKFIGPDSEGFQIWFEPHLREALQRQPTYNQYDHEAFPAFESAGLTVKTVIGEDSPVELVADVQMWDVELAGGISYNLKLEAGRSLAALAIRGHGSWTLALEADKPVHPFNHKDFTVIEAEGEQAEDVVLTAAAEGLRMILIEIPTEVDYPLYKNGR
ncbi:pirin family protein [Paenibacillus radicis (ex Xue et al. 2023)]|uniref:Pirin family protein n=1 Tax=Paenibacillus radicis (ex Xue et al. 2023) TaxID=2972489 RepID=A0ABT1Y9Q7_9BACL|nr:pirin family protein [Paenibacillus radicis (ex Xue et al. 2023)]MCR8629920.1 pirin family protein [Paenibacillus radicis (ex Xue et al. 2023)]